VKPSGKPPEGWRTCKPMEWQRALRAVPMSSGQKAVAFALASYASAGDGQSARPGLSRLQWATGTSRSTVMATLEALERMWLIHCYERSTGRGHASVYGLTMHDAIDRLGVTFEAWEAQRRPPDAKDKGSRSGPFPAAKGPRPLPKGSRIGA
jgi:hypothetical protein